MMKFLIVLALLPLLTGCPYPARTVMPLNSRVFDAETGQPIERAEVLRVVCDIHDFGCKRGYIDKTETNKDGIIELDGKRTWGLWIPAPGGLPVPDHKIAIWKAGYEVFVFSQYGDFERFFNYIQSSSDREDLKMALKEVPVDRKYYSPDDNPRALFEDGKIKLYKTKTHNMPLEPIR